MSNLNLPVEVLDQQLRVISNDLYFAGTHGLIPRVHVGMRAGERLAISTAAFQDIDSGYSAEPTTPGGARVVSSSTSDSAAGTGVQKVKCIYLDSNWNVKSEIVTLNGTTPVALTATDVLHIDEFYSIQVGSGGVAAGNIEWQNPDGTVTFARIPAGINIWLCARLHVPAGKVASIVSWSCGAYNGAVKFILRGEWDFTAEGGGPNVVHIRDLATVTGNSIFIALRIPITVTEKNHAKVSGIAKGPNTDASAAFRFWLQDKS